MAKQRRGAYRSINSLLLDDPSFKRLPAGARHLYETIRISRLNNMAGVFILDVGAVATLADQTGYQVEEIEAFLCELEKEDWIVRGDGLLWVRNQVQFDPHVDVDDPKHKKGLENTVLGMAPCALLESFCEYYGLTWPFKKRYLNNQLSLEAVVTDSSQVCKPHRRAIDDPSKGHARPTDGGEMTHRCNEPDSEPEPETDSEKERLTAGRRPALEELREKIKPDKKPVSEHQQFIAYFKSEFDRRFAEQDVVYVVEGGKDGESTRKILGRIGLQKAMEVAHYLIWDCEDQWIAKIGGYKISTMLGQLNSLLQQMAGVQSRAAPHSGPPRLVGNVKAAGKALERLTNGRQTITETGRLGDGGEAGTSHAVELDHTGQV